ncbi:outer membrane beta-barrel protein [Pedobacter sp. GR22-6]|uniref:outer membrane beta-barrel protein n=1 Tax=Pedobacter sp. GR22-6 TaxID=3127957 RepID=UPI00307F7CAA
MKFTSILSVLLFYGLYAHAQDPFERKVKFGIKGGFNASLFTRTVEPFGPAQRARLDYFRRFFHASGFGGLTAEGSISNRFSIGAEVLYSSRGMAHREKNDYVVTYDEEGNEQQAYNYFNYNLAYLEFPITVNYNFADPDSRTYVAAYAGMAPAISVRATTKVRYAESIDASGRRAVNEKSRLDNVNHFNNSILLGIKVGEHNTRSVSPLGDFRMSYTMLPVFKKDVAANGNNLKTAMLTCSIGLGLRF